MMDDVYEENSNLVNNELLERFSKRRMHAADQDKTIELVEKAKGSRTMKAFSEEIGFHPSVMSRVMSRQTKELSLLLISKIAAHADSSSGVTLEDLMVAQGFVRVYNTKLASRQFEEDCRRILSYELMNRGYSIVKCEVDSNRSGIDLSLRTNALSDSSDDSEEWAFKFLRIDNNFNNNFNRSSVYTMLFKIMAMHYLGYPARRITLVIDNEAAFSFAKKYLSSVTVPDEISVMLLSVGEKRIIDEYIAPLRDGRPGKTALC